MKLSKAQLDVLRKMAQGWELVECFNGGRFGDGTTRWRLDKYPEPQQGIH